MADQSPEALFRMLSAMEKRLNEINHQVGNLFKQIQEGMGESNINGPVKNKARDDVRSYIDSLPDFKAKGLPGGYNSRLKLIGHIMDVAQLTKNDIVLEFGVFQGESLSLLGRSPAKIFGFDSFEGLPLSEGIWQKGQFNNPGGVIYPLSPTTELVKGWFSDTLQPFIDSHDISKVKLVHIDCDIYTSAKEIFNTLFSLLPLDTFIIFDEYWNYDGWQTGEFKAFQEWITTSGRTYTYLSYMESGQSVAIRLH